MLEVKCENSLAHQQNNALRNSIAQCEGNLHIQFERMIEVKDFKNVLAVLDYFKEEKTCKDYLEQQRWGGKPCCPKCGYTKVYRTNRGFKCASRDCHKKFSVTVGTVMEQTKIKLRYWFAAIYLISAHKKGISSCQLARDLGVTQRTAWFLNHRIRLMMKEETNTQLQNRVQIDETFIGGKRRNMHGFRRQELKEKFGASGYGDKTTVFGMLEEGGKLRMMKVESNDGRILMPIIRKNVKANTLIVTDTHSGYNELCDDYTHFEVIHSRGNYVDKETGLHTNSIESAWAILKRGYIGIYHYMSPKHLDRYCHEFCYRFNTRGLSDTERFGQIMTRTAGRLMYKDLIAA